MNMNHVLLLALSREVFPGVISAELTRCPDDNVSVPLEIAVLSWTRKPEESTRNRAVALIIRDIATVVSDRALRPNNYSQAYAFIVSSTLAFLRCSLGNDCRATI